MAKKEYTSVETEASEQGYLFELLHGASLTSRLLDDVLESGREAKEIKRPDLFKKYPRLGTAAEAAEQALAELYQEVGRHWNPKKD